MDDPQTYDSPQLDEKASRSRPHLNVVGTSIQQRQFRGPVEAARTEATRIHA